MCEWVAEKRQTGMVKGQKLLKARLEVLEGHDCPHKRLFFFYYFKFTPSKAIMSLICKALLGVKENEKKNWEPSPKHGTKDKRFDTIATLYICHFFLQ